MRKTIEFYFDVGSPTAYLAYHRLLQLQQQYGATIDYRPVLLGGIFKATGNNSPVAVPAKGKYMLVHDLPRFARRYGVVLQPNPYFPVNTLGLMRAALAAQQLGCFDRYLAAVFAAMWADAQNMGEPAVVAHVLQAAELPVEQLLQLSQSPAIKEALVSQTEAAVARGLFGVPTCFVGEQMYFGQDRLDFIEQDLQARSRLVVE